MAGDRSAGRSAAFVISADYERRTGGWVYDDRLMSELRSLGWDIQDVIVPAGFPAPDDAAIVETKRLLAALPDGMLVLSDQLVTSVLPDLMLTERRRLRLVPIVHHPLALEKAPGAAEVEPVAQREKRALSAAHRVITTSDTTAASLAKDYGVVPGALIVAKPGVDRWEPSPGSAGGPPLLLAVGAVVPRKDHGTLVAAMAGLRDRSWRLVLVGNATRAADHVAALRDQIASASLADRVVLAGELDQDELDRLWGRADLFVSSSTHEGFGMAISEAVARGVPVVTTAAGAVTEWLNPAAGIMVGVGDAGALRTAIAHLLDDPAYRAELRAGALQAAATLPGWAETAAIVDRALAPR
jgi:glycosyltransferase involved in cell wall biosynthesis